MSFFQKLTPPKPHTEPFLDHVVSYISNDSATTYTSTRALRNSDIFASVRIIAGDIASCALASEKSTTTKLLNGKINDYTDSWHFIFSMAANVLLNGNAFAEIERDPTGKIIAFHQLTNSSVSVEQQTNRKLIYTFTDDEGHTHTCGSEDILHFKHFTTNGLIGESPLVALATDLKLQEGGSKLLSNFFNLGVHSGGILKIHKTDLDVAAKNEIRRKFEESNGGAENAVRTTVLDETTDYTPKEINTEILKLVNSNDWTTKQIAKVYGIGTDRLGVEANHSNTEQSNKMYLQNTLTHYLRVFESELSNKLDEPITFNVDRFNSDSQTTLENTIEAVKAKIMTIEEARVKIGLKPLKTEEMEVSK